MLVVGVLAYAASYFARGFLAGHQRFELYGLLVFLEAVSRVCFALAVVVGIASGQSAVALGMAVAPLMSLLVVPWFFARRDADRADPDAVEETEGGLTHAPRRWASPSRSSRSCSPSRRCSTPPC